MSSSKTQAKEFMEFGKTVNLAMQEERTMNQVNRNNYKIDNLFVCNSNCVER